MQQQIPPIELPNVECDYQPAPGSLASFIAGLPDKIDELLTAANWRSSSDENSVSRVE